MKQILEARDQRVDKIERLLSLNKVIVSLRCNYPGLDKDNQYTHYIIKEMHALISHLFEIEQSEFMNCGEGPVYLYVIQDGKAKNIKAKMIEIENHHPLGRLVDLDVYFQSIKSMSRQELGHGRRRCFLCLDEAFNCMVHKKHTLEDLIVFVHQKVIEYKKEKWCLDVIECSNQAMLYELSAYPSFGLVSPYSTGSHKDMDYYTFLDSISVLNKYMFQFAKLGYQDKTITSMLNEAIMIGMNCEKEMFQKTKGINTHKGLIFVLGTLVVSLSKTIYDNEPVSKVYKNSQLLTENKLSELKQLNHNRLSNGEKIYVEHKIEGVRKEAASGFPIIQGAIKLLDLTDKDSMIRTLIYIMSLCDDTTIINRHGLEGLDFVKDTMNHLLKHGYDKELLLQVNQEFIKKGISPGGSADLLCGTIFLSLIKNKVIKGEN